MYVELEYVKFKNILSYGAKEISHTFEPGLTAISGRNGAGKSTFLEVISYNWFGKPYRKIKLEALLNRDNKKGLETETGICVDHRDHYRIIRCMKPNKLQIFKNDEPLQLLSSKVLDQEDITKILGIDYKMFKQIVSLAVTYNKPFLTQEAAEKREIVESIFNIKIIGEMLEVLKKKISTEKVKYTVNKKTVEMLEENINIMRRNIIEVKKAVTEFEATRAKDLTTAADTITDKLRQIADTENGIEATHSRIAENEKQKSVIAASLSEKEAALAAITDAVDSPDAIRLTAEVADIDAKLTAIPARLTELENAPNLVNAVDDARAALIMERDAAIAAGVRLKAEVDAYVAADTDFATDAEYVKLAALATELEGKKTAVLATLGSTPVEERLKELQQLRDGALREKADCERTTRDEQAYIEYLKTNDVCKKCKGQITPEFREAEIKSSQVCIDADTLRIAEINIELGKVEAEIAAVDAASKSLTSIQTQITDAEYAKNTRINTIYNAKQQKIALMKTDLTALKTKIQTIATSIDNRNTELANARTTKIADLKAEQTNLELSKTLKLTELSNIRKEKRNAAEKEIAELKTGLGTVEQNIKNDTESAAKSKQWLQTIIDQLKAAEAQKKEIEERKSTFDLPKLEAEFNAKITDFKTAYAENSAMAEKLKVYDITAKMLSEEGIKSYFFKRLTPILNAKINEYLDKFDIPVRCQFDEQMEEKIYNVGNENEEVSYYSYSEGEKKSIDTAILMSFIDITKVICNWNCNILMIDELIDGQVDFARLEKMFDCLREFSGSGMIPSIYIISHRALDDIQNFFKRIITISKVDGFSELSMKKL